MKDDRHNENSDLADRGVSAHYRDYSSDTTPPELDRMILRTASAEVETRVFFSWSAAWMRPAAFAATLVLCIALIMEFGEVQDLLSPADLQPDSVTVSRPTTSTTAGADSTLTSDAPTMQSDVIERQTQQVDESEPADSFRDAAATTARQLRDVDAAASASLQQMPKSAALPAAAIHGADTGNENAGCTDSQRAQPADWVRCIEELQRAGSTELANLERQALRREFPSFPIP
jgi:hypothetical protein